MTQFRLWNYSKYDLVCAGWNTIKSVGPSIKIFDLEDPFLPVQRVDANRASTIVEPQNTGFLMWWMFAIVFKDTDVILSANIELPDVYPYFEWMVGSDVGFDLRVLEKPDPDHKGPIAMGVFDYDGETDARWLSGAYGLSACMGSCFINGASNKTTSTVIDLMNGHRGLLG